MRESTSNIKLAAISLAILLGLLLIGLPVAAQGQQADAAPPANDNFANAQALSGASGSVSGTNVEATSEPNEPNIVSGGTMNSVWYKFTAPSTGSLNIDTNGAGTISSDAPIAVFTGAAVDSLSKLTENGSYVPFGYSRMTFGVTSGTTYYIKVEGFGSLTGTFTLNYTLTPASPNDNFAAARSLYNFTGSILSISDTNVGATGEAGEPNHHGAATPINSVWFSWVAPSNVSMTFDTRGSNYDTILAVYTGAAVNSLTEITSNDDAPLTNTSRVTFAATAGTTYYIAVDGFNNGTGTFLLNWKVNNAESGLQFNYYLSSWTDFAVYRPSNNTWYIQQSASNGTSCCFRTQKFGQNGDVPVAGDFDGDQEADIAVWRPSNGTFYYLRSTDLAVGAKQWGLNGDVPLQGDFDGDDLTDFAVYRPSNSTFYIFTNGIGGAFQSFQWGQAGDVPAPADYDGDGRTDIAVFRKNVGSPTAYFYIRRSSDGALMAVQWGNEQDVVVPGDYDRDGFADIAVYRAATGSWYIRRSSDNTLLTQVWGAAGDLAVPGDYDSDGKTDVAVFRPSDGTFYVLRSQTGTLRAVNFGASGDVPVPNTNVH
ncbi:MAG: VCBS repeat-containing protein [Acidobacteria bacterium]|nr:VCBS repeat-containing protein [Acidobacteriota bacterium]